MGPITAGCGASLPPAYRTAPPTELVQLGLAIEASPSLLTGNVYVASSTTLDRKSGNPAGYGPMPGMDGLILVTRTGQRDQWSQAIASGSYQMGGLPTGVPLVVTATKPGYLPRTLTITIGPSGIGRLSFAFEAGDGDAYLLPQPGYLTSLPR